MENRQVKTSRHADKRMQQRAIPKQMIPLLMGYGTETYAGRGCKHMYLKKKDIKSLRKDIRSIAAHLDSLADTFMVLGEDGSVLTIGHQYQARRK